MKRLLIVIAVALTFLGCQPSGPTYDQALQTWKTEFEILEKMNTGKQEVVQLQEDCVRKGISDPEILKVYESCKKSITEWDQSMSTQQAKIDKAKSILEAAEKRR